MIANVVFDKSKSSVRRGRKAAGLKRNKIAELPKDEPLASSAVCFDEARQTISYK
jgi:hypothetical protein